MGGHLEIHRLTALASKAACIALFLIVSTCFGACPSTIGIENNNPGNLMVGRKQWVGAIGRDPWKHIRFDTPENGIRAIKILLGTYKKKYKVTTVERLVGIWIGPVKDDPKHQREAADYLKKMRRYVGVKIGQKIDLADEETLKKVTRAIIKAENYCDPYPESLYDEIFSKVK